MLNQKITIIERVKNFTVRYSPPGAELKSEWVVYLFGNITAFAVSLMFFASYASARSELYNYDRVQKKYILNEAATMQGFSDILGGYLLGFVLIGVIMLSFIIFRYSYYRQGSKSIYLMKRLPERNEIHKRAIPLPVIASLSCLIYAFILRFFYFAVYMIATPNKCLPAGAWVELWRLFR